MKKNSLNKRKVMFKEETCDTEVGARKRKEGETNPNYSDRWMEREKFRQRARWRHAEMYLRYRFLKY